MSLHQALQAFERCELLCGTIRKELLTETNLTYKVHLAAWFGNPRVVACDLLIENLCLFRGQPFPQGTSLHSQPLAVFAQVAPHRELTGQLQIEYMECHPRLV